MSERFVIPVDGYDLVGERWPGGSRFVVLLHEGVSDRRGWREVAERLAPASTVVAYDRRGHGESPPSGSEFTHVRDLLSLLSEENREQAWLVGASAGGGVALDAAILAPERVAGLVLLGTAVSGAPEPELSDTEAHFDALMEAATAAGDLDELNRLETWFWLDGPGQPEGRVGGAARALAVDMNAVIISYGTGEDEGASGADAWHRLGEVSVPVTVGCGTLDAPYLITRCGELARRLPKGRHVELQGMAHQPYLEDPSLVATLIQEALAPGQEASKPSG